MYSDSVHKSAEVLLRAPFVDSARVSTTTTRAPTDGWTDRQTDRRAYGRTDRRTNETNKREHGWMNADSLLQVRAPLVSQYVEERSYPCARAQSVRCLLGKLFPAVGIFFYVCAPPPSPRERDEIYREDTREMSSYERN